MLVKKHKSVAMRVIKRIAILVILAGALGVVAGAYYKLNRAQAQIRDLALTLGRIVAQQQAFALWDIDKQIAERGLKAVAKDSFLVFAYVIDDKKKVFASSGEIPESFKIKNLKFGSQVPGYTLETKDVFSGVVRVEPAIRANEGQEAYVGTLVLGFSNQAVIESAWNDIYAMIAFFIVIVIFIVLIIYRIAILETTRHQENEEKNRIEREAKSTALLRNIAITANTASCTESAIHESTRLLSEFMGWPLGHVYSINKNRDKLQSAKISYLQNIETYTDLDCILQTLEFAPGQALPGQAWSQASPQWEREIALNANPALAEAVAALKLKAGVAIPIIVHGDIAYVLQFFALDAEQPNKELLAILLDIGNQLVRVIERTQNENTLKKARDEAEAAAAAKSEFLANMSHELRTPMHAILNYSKMGLKRIDADDTTKVKKYLGNIQTAGERLLGLLNNLLDLAKMESDKIEFNFHKGDLIEVIDYSLSEIDPLFKDKNLQISKEVNTQLTSLVFDRQRMIQVLVNLLSNAIKFSERGGNVSIVLSDGQHVNGGAALWCRIVDEGAGIPEGELETVFDKFAQSSKTKTGAGGTGLGLSICRQIVEAHGGKIWAEGGSLKGAVLNFTLPRQDLQDKNLQDKNLQDKNFQDTKPSRTNSIEP